MRLNYDWNLTFNTTYSLQANQPRYEARIRHSKYPRHINGHVLRLRRIAAIRAWWRWRNQHFGGGNIHWTPLQIHSRVETVCFRRRRWSRHRISILPVHMVCVARTKQKTQLLLKKYRFCFWIETSLLNYKKMSNGAQIFLGAFSFIWSMVYFFFVKLCISKRNV